MANDTNGATGTQADPGTQPPAGDAATQADAAGGEQQAQPESISLEEAKKLRSESKSLRDRLKAFEEADRKRQESELSETERLTKAKSDLEQKLADAQRTNQERTVRYATVAEAAKLGFSDPDDAVRLLDQASIEFEDDGSPRNLAAQLGALAKAKPYLLGQTRSSGSFDAGTGNSQPAGARTYTREQLRDSKFFTDNQADILRAMNEGRITG